MISIQFSYKFYNKLNSKALVYKNNEIVLFTYLKTGIEKYNTIEIFF